MNALTLFAITLVILFVVGSAVFYFYYNDPDRKFLRESQKRYDSIHEKYKTLLNK